MGSHHNDDVIMRRALREALRVKVVTSLALIRGQEARGPSA